MTEFLLSQWPAKIAEAFFWVVLAAATFSYLSGSGKKILKPRNLIIGAFVFKFFYSVTLTIGQYHVWAGDELARFFLRMSLEGGFLGDWLGIIFGHSLGYFIFYTLSRFWFEFFLATLAAFVFYFLLSVLKKHNPRFFYEGEVELGALLAFLAGWPDFVLFVALSFVFVVLVSVFKLTFLKDRLTTLGTPFILSAVIVMAKGRLLIDLLGLSVLAV